MGGFNTTVADPYPIATELRPPSPLETLARMQAIKASQQEMQQRAQAMQTQALQQRELQMNLDQRRAINDAYRQAFTPQADGSAPQLDDTKLTNALATAGHGEAIPGILENLTKYRQGLATLRETNSKVAAAEADAAGNLAATVQAANNDPNLFHTLATDAINRKIIDPSHFAPLDQQLTQSLQQDPTGEQARALVKGWTDQMIAGSPKQQELSNARRTAAARETDAATRQTKETREAGQQQFQNASSDFGANPPQNAQEYEQRIGKLSPENAMRFLRAVPVSQYDPAKSGTILRNLGMTPEQQTQAGQAAANAKETARHNAVEESQGAQRNSIEGQRLKLQEQQFGFDTNGGVSDTAKALVSGQLDPQTARAMLRRNPGLIEQAKRLDPNFDEANIDNRYETLKEFTNTSVGKAGGQALALNTLIHHGDLYQQVGEALKNGTFRPGNAVYNAVSTLFGGPAPTNAALVGRFLAGETGKVASGGVPAEGEINGILKNLGTDASPEQIANAGKTILQIAAGRATPLMERVKNAKLDNVVHVLGDDAKGILQRRGFDPETMKPKQQGGGGNVPAVPTSIPDAARHTVHYSPSTKMFYYSTDEGKTWQTAKP